MEQSSKRTRFEEAVVTWGQLESMPNEMKFQILIKLPLNDLLIMQQVSKSAYTFIQEQELIERWFNLYMGSDKLISSWILQKMIARYDFQLEHLSENFHVFVSGLMSDTIALRIEDSKNNMLYKTLMSIDSIVNARQEQKNIWMVSIQNTRAGLVFLYNYLYRIMSLNDMVQDPAYQQHELDDLNAKSLQEQIETPHFDMFVELDVAREKLVDWERFHFGSNDRLRQTIMYYLAFENRFTFVDKNGNFCVQIQAKQYKRNSYVFFQIQLKNEFMSDLLKRMALPTLDIDESKPGRSTMWLGGPHINFIRIVYRWMTQDGLRMKPLMYDQMTK